MPSFLNSIVLAKGKNRCISGPFHVARLRQSACRGHARARLDAWGAHAAANMQKLAAAREAHVGEVEYELRVAREDVAELRARLGRQQVRFPGDAASVLH